MLDCVQALALPTWRKKYKQFLAILCGNVSPEIGFLGLCVFPVQAHRVFHRVIFGCSLISCHFWFLTMKINFLYDNTPGLIWYVEILQRQILSGAWPCKIPCSWFYISNFLCPSYIEITTWLFTRHHLLTIIWNTVVQHYPSGGPWGNTQTFLQSHPSVIK